MSFPLPLTSFEEYMVREDRPGYSMNFLLRLRCTGRIDPATLEQAAGQSVLRHPLLRSIIRQPAGSRWCWEPLAELPALVQVVSANPESEWPSLQRLDIARTNGLRLTIVPRTSTFDLLVQVHHACCDGMGILRFLEDLFREYANLRGDVRGPFPPSRIDEQRLVKRCVYGSISPQRVREAQRRCPTLLESSRTFCQPCAPLLPPRATPGELRPAETNGPPPDCGSLVIANRVLNLSATQTSEYVALARSLGKSVNTLLVRDTFLSLHHLRQHRQWGNERDTLRLTIPVNMREAGDHLVSAANVVSMLSVDRQAAELDDEAGLLQSIHDELTGEQRRERSYAFLLGLEFARRLPNGLTEFTRPDLCRSTCVLTNLMRVFDDSALADSNGRLTTDDFALESLEAYPPLRPGTQLVMAVSTYAGELTVGVRFDPVVLTASDMRELLAALRSRIQRMPQRNHPLFDGTEASEPSEPQVSLPCLSYPIKM